MEQKNAQDYVNEVKTEINQAKSCLETAKAKAEKAQNKQVIDQAISSLNNACDCLCSYQD